MTKKELFFRKYPSTTSLKCFEVSARHLSFTRAAEELHMTQSAVSKQIAQLEELLGNTLFYRENRHIILTIQGKRFLKDSINILKQIEMSILSTLSVDVDSEMLSISCPPTLCAKWLIPILKGFGRENPKIHLYVHEDVGLFCEMDEDIDIAIFFGEGVWPNTDSIKLFDEHYIAVCHPLILSTPIHSLHQLQKSILIQSACRVSLWYEYFTEQNILLEANFKGPRFDTFYSCIQAAKEACGIALIPKILVKSELVSGELIKAWPYEQNGKGAYYLVYRKESAKSKKVQTMIQWIQNRLN